MSAACSCEAVTGRLVWLAVGLTDEARARLLAVAEAISADEANRRDLSSDALAKEQAERESGVRDAK